MTDTMRGYKTYYKTFTEYWQYTAVNVTRHVSDSPNAVVPCVTKISASYFANTSSHTHKNPYKKSGTNNI